MPVATLCGLWDTYKSESKNLVHNKQETVTTQRHIKTEYGLTNENHDPGVDFVELVLRSVTLDVEVCP